MIKICNLVKKYGNYTAVDHINVTFDKGKVYGFLGPNGAGKSTTMNIMTGYIGATEGDVLINNKSIMDEPEEAKKYIGYLPEIPPLYPEMKVSEYLNFAAELKSIVKEKRKKEIDDVLELTKLNDVKERLIRNLSKGYRQRVGLAQAILGFPEIIILDEPTVGLDPKQIIEIRDVIRKLSKNHTVILSSHIMQEVRAVCDYIMIISKGKLIANDTPDNLDKLFIGENTLELTACTTMNNAKQILEDIKEITSIEYKKSSDEDSTDLTIVTPNKIDLRKEIFFAFSNAEIPIIKMNFKNVSLEDVFLELTSDNNNEHASDSKPDTLESNTEKEATEC